MKGLSILGSTGSIGTQTLEVVAASPERLSVAALAAHTNDALLEAQIRKFRPHVAALSDEKAAARLRARYDGPTEILSGEEGILACATVGEADTVLGAMVGYAGLKPILAAIAAHKNIALANKETLVAAGSLVMDAVKKNGVRLTPVDSEHSAIFQSLEGNDHKALKRILLTASGGPFRGKKREELRHVTVKECMNHPTWSMGTKVTLDSSTLANKGLEVIEAHWLFEASYDQIVPIIHPQSIVHSLVEYQDGAVIAQLGAPDMRLPIQYALTYPERKPSRSDRLDLTAYPNGLHFYAPDLEALPCLALAMRCARTGGTAPTVMNAANEIAVGLFLGHKIGYHSIYESVAAAVEAIAPVAAPDLDVIRAADQEARAFVRSYFRF